MKLCWDQVDLRAKTLTVPDTKNRNPLTLPLGPFILKLLTKRKKDSTEIEFVFPGSGKTGHLVESIQSKRCGSSHVHGCPGLVAQ